MRRALAYFAVLLIAVVSATDPICCADGCGDLDLTVAHAVDSCVPLPVLLLTTRIERPPRTAA